MEAVFGAYIWAAAGPARTSPAATYSAIMSLDIDFLTVHCCGGSLFEGKERQDCLLHHLAIPVSDDARRGRSALKGMF
jgi:hypothetical protein